MQGGPRGQGPEPHGTIVGSRGQGASVGRDRDRADRTGVAAQPRADLPLEGIPHQDAVVVPGRDDMPPVIGHRQRVDGFVVPREHAHQAHRPQRGQFAKFGSRDRARPQIGQVGLQAAPPAALRQGLASAKEPSGSRDRGLQVDLGRLQVGRSGVEAGDPQAHGGVVGPQCIVHPGRIGIPLQGRLQVRTGLTRASQCRQGHGQGHPDHGVGTQGQSLLQVRQGRLLLAGAAQADGQVVVELPACRFSGHRPLEGGQGLARAAILQEKDPPQVLQPARAFFCLQACQKMVRLLLLAARQQKPGLGPPRRGEPLGGLADGLQGLGNPGLAVDPAQNRPVDAGLRQVWRSLQGVFQALAGLAVASPFQGQEGCVVAVLGGEVPSRENRLG